MLNRRNFMKMTGVGVVGVIATQRSEAIEQDSGILDKVDTRDFTDKIHNGQIYEAPWPLCHQVIVMYSGRGDKYLLLYCAQSCYEGNVLNVCYYDRKDGGYNPFYTQEELQEKLKGWKLLKSTICVEDYSYETQQT